ncbi:hypothetical protein [Shinella zoogloeoides]|uniref:hypothetical protein n=1 Tax=Shinella zoogloeoides TaxID=352475 RepID=UPI00273ED5FA|nr:hypothetical protein [Shinella zoogloeoides]WLR90976.1 hypothetical protein Q9316_00070 [Shinella zoogloeoides]
MGGYLDLDQRQMAGGEPDRGWQVWCGSEMIGWLQISDNHIRGGAVEIPVFEAPTLPVLSSPDDYLLAPMTSNIRTIRLNIKRRAARLSNYQLNMAFDEEELKREFRNTHQIPASAEMICDHATDSYEFRWRVLETSISTSEEIFDLDQFTPNPDQR